MAKIAVIDDDPDIVEANTHLLRSHGFTVVSAMTAEAALALVTAERPDLIILDVMMIEPDDGFYLALQFRRMGITTPIIMLTSVSKTLGYQFGPGTTVPIEAFLEKPVPPAVLLDAVQSHLEPSQRSEYAGH